MLAGGGEGVVCTREELTRRANGSFRSKRSPVFWYFRISLSARVPGLYLLFLPTGTGSPAAVRNCVSISVFSFFRTCAPRRISATGSFAEPLRDQVDIRCTAPDFLLFITAACDVPPFNGLGLKVATFFGGIASGWIRSWCLTLKLR